MISVLVTTRNRAKTLFGFLDHFCRIKKPSCGWEIIVVNNGSDDDTSSVIDSFANCLPLRPLNEQALGKNRALNTGLMAINGDLVLFTDDDIFPCTDWLVKFEESANKEPDYSMFGGPIVARWETRPPPWVTWIDTPGPVYGLTDPTLEEGPIPPWQIFGGNMAVRAGLFRSGLSFDTSLGPRGSNYPIGGETELLNRLDAQGHKAWHIKDAVVEHLVQKHQLNQNWVFQRAFRFGRGQYKLWRFRQFAGARRWMGAPEQLYREMIKEALSTTAAFFALHQRDLFRARWRLNFVRGQLTEARTMARETFNSPAESNPT